MTKIEVSTMRGRPLEPSKTLIVVKSQFEGIHAWDKCPHDDVGFLRHPHRHIFHVTMKVEVSHDDRQLEFIQVKRKLTQFLNSLDVLNLGSTSCEMLAKQIGRFFVPIFPVNMVSVSEDEENSAEVYFS